MWENKTNQQTRSSAFDTRQRQKEKSFRTEATAFEWMSTKSNYSEIYVCEICINSGQNIT